MPRRGSAEKPTGSPNSKGTYGTKVREGREPAGSAGTGNCSTGTVGPEGRVGRGKPVQLKEKKID
ncbi:hypothetical protein KI387_036580 [Taxus chinensis]|uniref:Uncharacterized protein n=1 Tax=Taxus chinensis TaxID=29808 RepID=A0AA38FSA8_TAXCH|nr:hypothetical protein KI387_036580 [Taxus chinensis]